MSEVLPYVGAAVGYMVGGPTGAQWGFALGSVGAAALADKPHIQGPRLEDLKIVGTDYGQPIPWVIGAPRIAPQYIWASPIREIATTKRQGKGGGAKQTTYTYECDVMLLLSENVTEGVARDWINNELVRNGLNVKDGVWEGISIYTGDQAQMPDPTYEAALGQVPAYRGRTTVVIRSLQLNNGKQLPNIEHQFSTASGLREDLIFYAPFDDSFTDISEPNITPTVTTSDNFGFQFVPGIFNEALSYTGNPTVQSIANIQYSSVKYDLGTADFSIGLRVRIAAHDPVGAVIFRLDYPGGDTTFIRLDVTADGLQLRLGANSYDMSLSTGAWYFIGISRTAGTVRWWLDGVSYLSVSSPAAGQGADRLRFYGNESANRHPAVTIDDFFIIKGTDIFLAGGDWDLQSPAITGGAPVLSDVLRALLARAGYNENEYSVSGALAQELAGYAAASVTGSRAHLEALQPFGKYEASCSDKLYIFPRAVTPAGVIPWGDLGASESPYDPAEPFPLRVSNEVEIPAQVAVRYRNAASDWNLGTEFADRQVSTMLTTQTVDLAYGLSPHQAKVIAETILKDAVASSGSATLRLAGRKHAKYEPGDVLTTTSPTGVEYRFRIVTKMDYVFMLEWGVVLDDIAALEATGITFEGYVPNEEPVRVSPTEWEVVSIPPLMDSDASAPGPYVAITPAIIGTNEEWPGAVFVRARLPEAYEQVFISGDRSVIGTCTTTLGDFAQGSTVPDPTVLTVSVRGTLNSVSFYDFFADRTLNAAVVGDEPIRFMRAEFVSTDDVFRVYRLHGIMRGQLGQEHLIGGHGPDERFVLLDTSIRRMANQITDIGQAQQVKAATLNTFLDSVTDEDFTDDGIALRPYSPVSPVVSWDASGDLTVMWVRRSRLVARYNDQGVFAPLGEESEAYRVRAFDDPNDPAERTEDTTTAAWTYNAADIASDGFTTGDVITIEVRQLSASVGEGFALTLEATVP